MGGGGPDATAMAPGQDGRWRRLSIRTTTKDAAAGAAVEAAAGVTPAKTGCATASSFGGGGRNPSQDGLRGGFRWRWRRPWHDVLEVAAAPAKSGGCDPDQGRQATRRRSSKAGVALAAASGMGGGLGGSGLWRRLVGLPRRSDFFLLVPKIFAECVSRQTLLSK